MALDTVCRKMKSQFLITFSYLFVKLDHIYLSAFTIFIFCIVRLLTNSNRTHGQYKILRSDPFLSSLIFPLFPTVALTVGRCLSLLVTLVFWLCRAPKRRFASLHFQRCGRREHKIFTA